MISGASLGIDGLVDPVEIGSGGFGTVYRAEQPAFQRVVAVKILHERLQDSGLRHRFERECKALGVLSGHPNIVTVYDAGLSGSGRPYLVMDHLAAGSLGDRLRLEGRLGWEEVADITVKLAGGLETAHRADVLHRDLKPDNILVSGFGEPKLGDFGIAQVKGGTETKTGHLTASIAHAAPELLDGKRPTVQSDLYSMGSTMFMLLAGHPPFLRTGEESFLPALMRISIEPVPDLRPTGVPDGMCAVVERLMAKSPDDRYRSAAELGVALQQVQQRSGLPMTQMTVEGGLARTIPTPRPAEPSVDLMQPPHREPAPRRSPGPFILAGVVGLVVLVLGGVLVSGLLAPGGPLVAPPPTFPTTAPSAPTATLPTVPVGPLTPARATASSVAPNGVDDSGQPTGYGPEHLIDGDHTTAWRTPGNGIGQVVQVSFATPVQLRQIGLVPGYAKTDPATGQDRFTQNRIITSVRYTFDDGSQVVATFSASPVVQSIPVEVRTQSVTIEILGTTADGGRDFTPISEVVARGCAC